MESAIKWYYKRIHACDLNGWERNVERDEQQQNFDDIPPFYHHHEAGKRGRRRQFVDIDVVGGTAWSKNKARQGAATVLIEGLARIVMFPFFVTWWAEQLTLASALAFSLLHVAMATSLTCYLLDPGAFVAASVPPGEMAVPYALMLVVGSIHCQIVATRDMRDAGWMGQDEEVVRMEGDKQDTSVDDAPDFTNEDTITVRVWDGEGRCVKMPLNFVQIGAAIMRKAYFSNARGHLEGAKTAVLGATCFVPLLHRLHRHRGALRKMETVYRVMLGGNGGGGAVQATVLVTLVARAIFTFALAVMLVTTDRAFRKRLRHAAHFARLTSVRRAARSGLPHFRLSEMARVKAWLSLRSYLQRRGPQRSTDIILSAAYTAFMLLLCFSTVKMMGSSSCSLDSLLVWECVAWQAALALFLLGYVFTGAQIHRKYAANCSILLTEQFNVFMQMENFPEKKEKLQRVNNALTVTSKLIKETRASSSIFGGGLTNNSLFYNLLKVLVLSAVSGAISEVLGFKVKVWKIKD